MCEHILYIFLINLLSIDIITKNIRFQICKNKYILFFLIEGHNLRKFVVTEKLDTCKQKIWMAISSF